MTYSVSAHRKVNSNRGALVDRGANGGFAGFNVRIIARTDREVNVSSIDNHQMTNLNTAGGVIQSQKGDIIVIMNQYAHVPQNGKTIHLAIQLESFGTKVNDRSLKLKQGTQTVSTLDGYVNPLNFVNGLAYMPI